MKSDLDLEYKILTKTYLKPTYIPTYVTVVTTQFLQKTFFTQKKISTKTHIVTKHKNSKCNKTQKLQALQVSKYDKTQNVTKLKM